MSQVPGLQREERRQLAGILEIQPNDLDGRLEPYLQAAAEEYIRMFLGQRVYTRGSDIREYRLLLLIKHAFGGRIPSEARVSQLFQTTESQSRALIRSVISKFQYELNAEINASLTDLLASAQPSEGDDLHIIIDSENLVDELNRRIQAIDGTLPPVRKERGTASTYVIKPSAYARLEELLAQ